VRERVSKKTTHSEKEREKERKREREKERKREREKERKRVDYRQRERERLVEGYDKRRRLRQLSHRLPVKTSVDAYGLILTAPLGQKKSVGQFLNIEYFKNFL
jgi:hypothetical protein